MSNLAAALARIAAAEERASPAVPSLHGAESLDGGSLATAWAKDNIQVNAVLPGWIDTALTRRARAEVDGLHERVGTPRLVALHGRIADRAVGDGAGRRCRWWSRSRGRRRR